MPFKYTLFDQSLPNEPRAGTVYTGIVDSVMSILRGPSIQPPLSVDDVFATRLVLSELIANATREPRNLLRLRLGLGGVATGSLGSVGSLFVAASDSYPGFVRDPEREDFGRGSGLLTAYAHRTHFELVRNSDGVLIGKEVTSEILLSHNVIFVPQPPRIEE